MNIDSLSSSGGQINGANGSVERRTEALFRPGVARDTISVDRSVRIDSAMDRIPEVRAEVVERGRRLLADPNYPGAAITQKIAALIVPFEDTE